MLKRNKRGQAAVEYILLIVVIASIVAGLASFNGSIEQKFKDAKVDLRDKLAGSGTGGQLHRSDFFTGKISTAGGAGGAGGAQGAGGGGAGAGGAGGAGGKKTTGGGAEGEGLGANGTGEQPTPAQTQEPNIPHSRQSKLQQEQEAIDKGNKAAKEYRQAYETEEEAYQEKEKEAISERQLALASEDERARLLRKAKDEGITTDKQQADEARNWKIGKFIIIIMLVLFVFIIILKSRQSRE